MSLTDLYIIFFRHSRVNGNPVAVVLDSCLRRNDTSGMTHKVFMGWDSTLDPKVPLFGKEGQGEIFD